MDTTIACVNGVFVPAQEAVVSVADRGFRFGDGVFETIHLQAGVPYQWEAHLARLQQGLSALRIPALPELAAQVRAIIHKNKAVEGTIRIAISRGVGSAGYLPAAGISPTCIIEYLPARPLPASAYRMWLSSYRRVPPASLPVSSKLAQGLNSTLALLEAQKNRADEAVQLSTNGLLASAASGNLFWVKGKNIFTPSLETGCLAGTMRARLLAASPITIHESAEPFDTLEHADAVFISNARLGVWPVSAILPNAISYDPEHPALATLAAFIQRDREVYTTKNKSIWQ